MFVFYHNEEKMKHVIISDTHSAHCINKSYNYLRKVVKEHSDIDAVVINGDLLGVFSMKDSCVYKDRWIEKEELLRHLKEGAPKFYKQFMETKEVTPKMVMEYVLERYDWCLDVLKKFSKVNHTIFNMGNHESPLHFLVLQEIPFLTVQKHDVIANVDKKELKKIFDYFETNLYRMEESHDFKYIRDDVYVMGDTLIMGIPGESHATIGPDPESRAQEEKTKELIKKAEAKLSEVSNIVIYNHTQGAYEKETGNFNTASLSLKKFMEDLPINIMRRVFVQSHNHWNYTQYLMNGGFSYVMNNAGLHDGIFNMIAFDMINMQCFDADPNRETMTELSASMASTKVSGDEELIGRYYPDVDFVTKRKEIHQVLNNLNLTI